MTTWNRGSRLLIQAVARLSIPLDRFLEEVAASKPPRVRGTAVFLTRSLEGAPPSLVLHFRHNKVLHEEVILVSIITEEVPELEEERRVVSERIGEGFHRVRAYYGFMERPDVQHVVAVCCGRGMNADPGRRPTTSVERISLQSGRRGWCAGASACTRSWRGTRAPRSTSFVFRPTASSSSAG